MGNAERKHDCLFTRKLRPVPFNSNHRGFFGCMAVMIAGLNKQTGYVITAKYLNGTRIYRSKTGLVYLKSSKYDMTIEKAL